MIKLILFDLDGTLIDSVDFIVWSFVEAGRRLGIEIDPLEIRRLVGYPIEDFVYYLVSKRGVDEKTLELFFEVRRRLFEENWEKSIRVFPDVKPVLDELRGSGYVLGVASSSRVERINLFLRHFNLEKYFNVIVGAGSGLRGKPHPDVLLRALSEADVEREEAVYVGDREVDCIASQRAGVRFVLVDRENLGPGGCSPWAIIPSLRSLLPLLIGELARRNNNASNTSK